MTDKNLLSNLSKLGFPMFEPEEDVDQKAREQELTALKAEGEEDQGANQDEPHGKAFRSRAGEPVSDERYEARDVIPASCGGAMIPPRSAGASAGMTDWLETRRGDETG